MRCSYEYPAPVTDLQDLKRIFNERPEGIVTEIDPADVMHDEGELHRDYFGAGQRALRNVRLALLAAMKSEVRSILDLPSGHGRVLRVLKAAFPGAALTACDTNRDAVDFCARVMRATPVYSDPDPGKIAIEDRFDLIYCGSLLTHVDERGWDGFLTLFERLLEDRGVLVFTTGGRSFADRISTGRRMFGLPPEDARGMAADYGRTGFGYRNWPGNEGYGMAMAAPWWTCRKLERFPSLRLLSVTEQTPQDIVACQKGSIADSARVSG
jgi:SAM-dependent methyltransferase